TLRSADLVFLSFLCISIMSFDFIANIASIVASTIVKVNIDDFLFIIRKIIDLLSEFSYTSISDFSFFLHLIRNFSTIFSIIVRIWASSLFGLTWFRAIGSYVEFSSHFELLFLKTISLHICITISFSNFITAISMKYRLPRSNLIHFSLSTFHKQKH